MARSPETAARLAKYAEAKKGRKNLKSLDRNLGMVGFDNVQDQDGERPASNYTYPWVRLKYASDWQSEELAKRWPVRKVAIPFYKSPARGAVWQTVTVHPVDVVIAWFRFLWPDPEEWGTNARKYLVGYTERMTHDFPGVGAKVLVHKCRSIGDESLLPVEVAVDSLASYAPMVGNGLFTVPELPGAFCRLDPERDKWDVIG